MTFNTLNWLADENVSPRVVEFLRQQQLDVLDVKELGWQGKEDHYLLSQAYLANRVVLTHDADFGTLAIHQGQPYYGIIYLRLKNLKVPNVIRVLGQLLALETKWLPGMLVVVEETCIRIH